MLCKPIGLLVLLALGVPLWAQRAADPGPAQSALPVKEIEKLVAPIALYPDVLVSQVLPACTFPIEIVPAARLLRAKTSLEELDKQPWDVSVKALCRYPEVLFKLDEDLDWSNALGAAFMDQQADVLSAIQGLRAEAQTDGDAPMLGHCVNHVSR